MKTRFTVAVLASGFSTIPTNVQFRGGVESSMSLLLLYLSVVKFDEKKCRLNSQVKGKCPPNELFDVLWMKTTVNSTCCFTSVSFI